MKKFSAAFVALAVAAPGALAANQNSLKVSPKSVKRGKKVTVSGTVTGCSGAATIYSSAFKGATKKKFGGIPAVSAKIKHGKYSVKVKISKKVKKGRYNVSGRCGGGNIGTVVLTVKKAHGGGGGGGFGFY
ncbi:MAG: hypothetical protein JOZ73_06505 [Solirubrobacterales bacterium]|nr:hypothetical protein [Solirubrobacterales bacterium]